MPTPKKPEPVLAYGSLAPHTPPPSSLGGGGPGLPRVFLLTETLDIVEPVNRWLQRSGYPLRVVPFESLDRLPPVAESPDVLLLHCTSSDFSLSRLANVLRHHKDRRKATVILLTTREAIGYLDLTSGFDDFVCAPYDPREVEVRIRCAVWRRHGVQVKDIIMRGDLVIDLGNYEVTIRGEPVDLTLKEYELLKYLATRQGRVFTREHLLTEVWGYNYYGGTRTVDVHVRRLRVKIERGGQVFIQTVRGVGYKFGE